MVLEKPLSNPFFANNQNARRRQIRTADQDVEAFQRGKPDCERIIVEKAAQSAESPGSYTLRKLQDRGRFCLLAIIFTKSSSHRSSGKPAN